MADQNGSAGGQGQAANPVPRLAVLVQYSKDLSFENPNAPRTLGAQQKSPNISVQINVNARQIAENDYEVNLVLEGGAGEGENTLFKFELNYAGVFRLENIPPQQIQPAVMIEGPRLLFPFARQIVAEAVRNGGFPPLYIDPIDFVALYQQRVAAGAAAINTGAA
jgi:preprotein translocase subunit SecB